MKTFQKSKGLLGIMAIFIVAMFVYNLFFKPAATPLSNEISAAAIGDDLVKIQSELQLVKLDRTLFSSPFYLLLKDFTVAVPAQATGRSNPFDSIGRD